MNILKQYFSDFKPLKSQVRLLNYADKYWNNGGESLENSMIKMSLFKTKYYFSNKFLKTWWTLKMCIHRGQYIYNE